MIYMKAMKRRVSYTTKLKNPLVWLAALSALAAAAGYIANATCGKGAGVCGTRIWLRVVLPVAAALYFCYQLLIHGRDRLFRLSLPFWMLEIGFIYETFHLGLGWYWVVLLILADLVLLWAMHRCLSGTLRFDWLIILIAGVYAAGIVYANRVCLSQLNWTCLSGFLPDLLFMLAYILLCFAMRRLDDGKYHPYWGDRLDGRKVRSLNPITVVGSYIMPERNEANVLFRDKLEITALERYIRAKREAGWKDFGMTDALLAAFVRTASKYPGLNRFLSGQKIYNRDDEILFCMTVKKELTTEAPDTVIKLHLKPGDTVQVVYEKFRSAVADVRKTSDLDSHFDGVAAAVGMIPGVLLKFVIWFLKLLDYFGLLPRFLLEVSPFHATVYFTSMGSLGINAVYHHLYNFGNVPMFMAFGKKYKAVEEDENGNIINKRYMDYTFNVDERTVDGFYYASSIKFFHKLLLHPERLDDPEMEINHDIP